MSWVTIIGFLKAILPTKKIAAWILGLIAAVVAIVMGVNSADLKTQFCANDPVSLPKIQVSPPAAVAAPAVAAPPVVK